MGLEFLRFNYITNDTNGANGENGANVEIRANGANGEIRANDYSPLQTSKTIGSIFQFFLNMMIIGV